MSLSPDEAAETLRDIAAVETHSHRAYGYREASPHLVLWGILWAIAYATSCIWPLLGGTIWIAVVTLGFIAGYFIAFRAGVRRNVQAGTSIGLARRHAADHLHWTFSAIAFIASMFIAAEFAVIGPISPRQIAAFIPLVVAAGYAVLGLWVGLRFIAIGAALAALTLGGFFLLPAHFGLWMAGVGGGALILGGLWLRRV